MKKGLVNRSMKVKMINHESLTERQTRELVYHREHAELHKEILNQPISYDVVLNKKRRWWNQLWAMYSYLLNKELRGKNVLVMGCGFGLDAILLARTGANVTAFDLSPEAILIARELANREGLKIAFAKMPAEKLRYDSDSFDVVFARDILHHVDIPTTIAEILRVSKPGAIFYFNEVYSHSLMTRVRCSKIIDNWLYPKLVKFIYQGKKAYITEDERKLTETDVRLFLSLMVKPETKKYFYVGVTRLAPDTYAVLSKMDRLLLILLAPIAHVLGSRVLVGGVLKE